jgi:hypothetical protein
MRTDVWFYGRRIALKTKIKWLNEEKHSIRTLFDKNNGQVGVTNIGHKDRRRSKLLKSGSKCKQFEFMGFDENRKIV